MEVKKIILDETTDDTITVTAHADIATAAAYDDKNTCDKHAEEVKAELDKRSDEVKMESPEAPEVKQDSMYTKKIKLEESIENFKLSDIDGSKDDKDRYIEFDMFDFIYSLFASETDSLTRPLKALSNIKATKKDGAPTFNFDGSDKYTSDVGELGSEGVAQISTDTDGNVVLYQDSVEKFDRVLDICKEYGFTYEGPTPKKAPWVRWNYSLKIVVPTYADGYPMEVEDYFEQKGIPMEEVMPPEFLRGRSKDYKRMNDEVEVEVIYKKYKTQAGNSNDPLDGFIKDMFKELDSHGVKYNRKELKDRFYADFADDFEDEE